MDVPMALYPTDLPRRRWTTWGFWPNLGLSRLLDDFTELFTHPGAHPLPGRLRPLLPPTAFLHLFEVLSFGAGTEDFGPGGAFPARKRRALKIRTEVRIIPVERRHNPFACLGISDASMSILPTLRLGVRHVMPSRRNVIGYTAEGPFVRAYTPSPVGRTHTRAVLLIGLRLGVPRSDVRPIAGVLACFLISISRLTLLEGAGRGSTARVTGTTARPLAGDLPLSPDRRLEFRDPGAALSRTIHGVSPLQPFARTLKIRRVEEKVLGISLCRANRLLKRCDEGFSHDIRRPNRGGTGRLLPGAFSRQLLLPSFA